MLSTFLKLSPVVLIAQASICEGEEKKLYVAVESSFSSGRSHSLKYICFLCMQLKDEHCVATDSGNMDWT